MQQFQAFIPLLWIGAFPCVIKPATIPAAHITYSLHDINSLILDLFWFCSICAMTNRFKIHSDVQFCPMRRFKCLSWTFSHLSVSNRFTGKQKVPALYGVNTVQHKDWKSLVLSRLLRGHCMWSRPTRLAHTRFNINYLHSSRYFIICQYLDIYFYYTPYIVYTYLRGYRKPKSILLINQYVYIYFIIYRAKKYIFSNTKSRLQSIICSSACLI